MVVVMQVWQVPLLGVHVSEGHNTGLGNAHPKTTQKVKTTSKEKLTDDLHPSVSHENTPLATSILREYPSRSSR